MCVGLLFEEKKKKKKKKAIVKEYFVSHVFPLVSPHLSREISIGIKPQLWRGSWYVVRGMVSLGEWEAGAAASAHGYNSITPW